MRAHRARPALSEREGKSRTPQIPLFAEPAPAASKSAAASAAMLLPYGELAAPPARKADENEADEKARADHADLKSFHAVPTGRPPSGQDGLRGNSLPRGHQRPQGRQALHTAGRHSRRHQRPLRHQAPHTAGWTPPIAAPKARLRRWPIPCGMGRKIRNNAGFGYPLP